MITLGYQVLGLETHTTSCKCSWCKTQKLTYQSVNRKIFPKMRHIVYNDKIDDNTYKIKNKCVKCHKPTYQRMYCGACKKKVWDNAL